MIKAFTSIMGLVPGWVWSIIVAALLTLLGATKISASTSESKYTKEKADHAETRLNYASAENRSLLNMVARYNILSSDLATISAKERQNASQLQIARDEIKSLNLSSSLRNPAKTAAQRELEFRAAGYQRASEYATGVEGVYRACKTEYIDLGLGTGGAAEASDAAYAQRDRAEALTKVLKPIAPVPPIPPIK